MRFYLCKTFESTFMFIIMKQKWMPACIINKNIIIPTQCTKDTCISFSRMVFIRREGEWGMKKLSYNSTWVADFLASIQKSSVAECGYKWFLFCFLTTKSFETPRVSHWTYPGTSLKIWTKSIKHRLGCIRIKNWRCQISNFCSQGLTEFWHHVSHNAISFPVVILIYYLVAYSLAVVK